MQHYVKRFMRKKIGWILSLKDEAGSHEHISLLLVFVIIASYHYQPTQQKFFIYIYFWH